MTKLDKELADILDPTFGLPAFHKPKGNLEDLQKTVRISQIKTVILEALKKEWPGQKDYVGFVEPHTGTDKPDGEVFGYAKEIEGLGYNQALADCLEVVKEVLK